MQKQLRKYVPKESKKLLLPEQARSWNNIAVEPGGVNSNINTPAMRKALRLSLAKCSSLTLEGDILFGGNITIEGDVKISNRSDKQAVIADGTTVTGDMVF